MTVEVSATQASRIYRELNDLDSTRRAARRTARHLVPRSSTAAGAGPADPADLARETSLQVALVLVQPYITAGGPMSRSLAVKLVDLLAEADELADAQTSTDPAQPEAQQDRAARVTEAAGRVLLRASLLAALDGTGAPRQRGSLEH